MAAEKKEASVLAKPPAKPPVWNDPRYRAVFFQVLVLGGIFIACYLLVNNTIANLARQGIASGFAFLGKTAGFSISMTLIDYSEENTSSHSTNTRNCRVYKCGDLRTFCRSVRNYKPQYYLFNCILRLP